MNGNTWLCFALIAFLAFCILSMLFIGRYRGRQHDTEKEDGRSEKQQ